MPCILVIRPEDPFTAKLREAGFEVLNLDLIRTEPVSDLSDLDEKIGRIREYDGLLFTSPRAAEVFLQRIEKHGREFAGKIYVLGRRAKKIFEQAGFDTVYVPSANTAAELVGSFDISEFAGKRLLFVRGEKSMRIIPDLLGGVAEIDETIVYRTIESIPGEEIVGVVRERLTRGGIDWICFFSPSGIEGFMRLFDSQRPRTLRAATIGETTAQKARDAGFVVDFVSRRSNSEDFATDLIEYLSEPSVTPASGRLY